MNRPPRLNFPHSSSVAACPPYLKKTSQGLVLILWVQPGAKKTGWSGTHGDQLKLTVQAPPVENAANQGCLSFLAHWFGIKKSEVLLVKGEKSRSKHFLLKGVALEKALSLIPVQIQGQQQ